MVVCRVLDFSDLTSPCHESKGLSPAELYQFDLLRWALHHNAFSVLVVKETNGDTAGVYFKLQGLFAHDKHFTIGMVGQIHRANQGWSVTATPTAA